MADAAGPSENCVFEPTLRQEVAGDRHNAFMLPVCRLCCLCAEHLLTKAGVDIAWLAMGDPSHPFPIPGARIGYMFQAIRA
jgi:hypothetical protein